jgi:hypothetical protein
MTKQADIKVGDRVRYVGSTEEQVRRRNYSDPRGVLDFDTVYEVKKVTVFPYHTFVKLKWIDDDRFNSVVFKLQLYEIQ